MGEPNAHIESLSAFLNAGKNMPAPDMTVAIAFLAVMVICIVIAVIAYNLDGDPDYSKETNDKIGLIWCVSVVVAIIALLGSIISYTVIQTCYDHDKAVEKRDAYETVKGEIEHAFSEDGIAVSAEEIGIASATLKSQTYADKENPGPTRFEYSVNVDELTTVEQDIIVDNMESILPGGTLSYILYEDGNLYIYRDNEQIR